MSGSIFRIAYWRRFSCQNAISIIYAFAVWAEAFLSSELELKAIVTRTVGPQFK